MCPPSLLVPGLEPWLWSCRGEPLWQSRQGRRTQPTSAAPTGEQPDASLPLHVLPLYSLLAPEKQAQVTVWGLGWRPSRGS